MTTAKLAEALMRANRRGGWPDFDRCARTIEREEGRAALAAALAEAEQRMMDDAAARIGRVRRMRRGVAATIGQCRPMH